MRGSILLPLLAACAEAPGTLAGARGEPGADSGTAPTVDSTDSGETIPEPEGPRVDVAVETAPGLDCADPQARAALGPFEPRTADAGWPEAGLTGTNLAFGFAVGDADGDGDLDVLVPHNPGLPDLLINDGTGRFALASIADEPSANTAAFLDLDGDDDLDVLLGASAGPAHVLANDGPGSFTDTIPETWRVNTRIPMGSTWADVDADGDLDGFVFGNAAGPRCVDGAVVQDTTPNLFWRNDGDLQFTDLAPVLPVSVQAGYGQAGAFVDLDGDKDQDLLLVNDFGAVYEPNQAILNDGGSWTLAAPGSGLDLAIEGMGLDIADLDANGIPDFLISDWGRAELLLGLGPFAWYDAAQAVGLTPSTPRDTGWGGTFGDVDNDGDLDIAMAFGPAAGNPEDLCFDLPPQAEKQPDALWLQGADRTFTEVSETWGVASEGNDRAAALVDLTGDGWLDLLVQDIGGNTHLAASRCGSEAWLEVELRAPTPNTRGVGAQVFVVAGGRTRERTVRAGSVGLAAGVSPQLHFGLADAVTVDRLVVLWPDGTWSEAGPLAPNQRVTLRRQEM